VLELRFGKLRVALPRRGQRKFQPFCPRANVHFFVLSRWHFADGIKLSNCAVTRLFRGYDRKDSGLIGLAGRDRQAENKTGREEFHQTGVNMLFNYCNTAKFYLSIMTMFRSPICGLRREFLTENYSRK